MYNWHEDVLNQLPYISGSLANISMNTQPNYNIPRTYSDNYTLPDTTWILNTDDSWLKDEVAKIIKIKQLRDMRTRLGVGEINNAE
jgi:hypothetical protein